jgi:hypothetical protein
MYRGDFASKLLCVHLSMSAHSGRNFCESDCLPARSMNTNNFFGHLRQYRESEEFFSLLCDVV